MRRYGGWHQQSWRSKAFGFANLRNPADLKLLMLADAIPNTDAVNRTLKHGRRVVPSIPGGGPRRLLCLAADSADYAICHNASGNPCPKTFISVQDALQKALEDQAYAKPQLVLSNLYKRGFSQFLSQHCRATIPLSYWDGRIYAMDCEMIATELDPDYVARISLVDSELREVFDEFVKPGADNAVRNLRTLVSGVTAADIQNAKYDREQAVQAMLRAMGCEDMAPLFYAQTPSKSAILAHLDRLGKKLPILLGHALWNDTATTKLSSWPLQLDTQAIYHAVTDNRGLRGLASQVLGVAIQHGSHSSVDDAKATMDLLNLFVYANRLQQVGSDCGDGSGGKSLADEYVPPYAFDVERYSSLVRDFLENPEARSPDYSFFDVLTRMAAENRFDVRMNYVSTGKAQGAPAGGESQAAKPGGDAEDVEGGAAADVREIQGVGGNGAPPNSGKAGAARLGGSVVFHSCSSNDFTQRLDQILAPFKPGGALQNSGMFLYSYLQGFPQLLQESGTISSFLAKIVMLCPPRTTVMLFISQSGYTGGTSIYQALSRR